MTSPDAFDEMVGVNLDVYKDVHARDFGDVHRHKATMTIVYKEVCTQSRCTEVIYATSSVGYIAQDEAMLYICKTAHKWLCHV